MAKGKCPHCGETDCYEHCYKADNGKHQPDNATAQAADGYDKEENIVVDVNCKTCGQSGSFWIPATDVNW